MAHENQLEINAENFPAPIPDYDFSTSGTLAGGVALATNAFNQERERFAAQEKAQKEEERRERAFDVQMESAELDLAEKKERRKQALDRDEMARQTSLFLGRTYSTSDEHPELDLESIQPVQNAVPDNAKDAIQPVPGASGKGHEFNFLAAHGAPPPPAMSEHEAAFAAGHGGPNQLTASEQPRQLTRPRNSYVVPDDKWSMTTQNQAATYERYAEQLDREVRTSIAMARGGAGAAQLDPINQRIRDLEDKKFDAERRMKNSIAFDGLIEARSLVKNATEENGGMVLASELLDKIKPTAGRYLGRNPETGEPTLYGEDWGEAVAKLVGAENGLETIQKHVDRSEGAYYKTLLDGLLKDPSSTAEERMRVAERAILMGVDEARPAFDSAKQEVYFNLQTGNQERQHALSKNLNYVNGLAEDSRTYNSYMGQLRADIRDAKDPKEREALEKQLDSYTEAFERTIWKRNALPDADPAETGLVVKEAGNNDDEMIWIDITQYDPRIHTPMVQTKEFLEKLASYGKAVTTNAAKSDLAGTGGATKPPMVNQGQASRNVPTNNAMAVHEEQKQPVTLDPDASYIRGTGWSDRPRPGDEDFVPPYQKAWKQLQNALQTPYEGAQSRHVPNEIAD